MDRAKERIILARQTHMDSLVAKLMEPRVRMVIQALIAGDLGSGDTYQDDVSYVRDLGLIQMGPLRVANPIYREVIIRVLSAAAQDAVLADPRSFVQPDRGLDVNLVLHEFAAFWRLHGDVLATKMPYNEVACQLVLLAYLQRVVNGGGYVDREYGVGKGAMDVLIRWPCDAGEQRFAFELKVRSEHTGDPEPRGLEQLDGYLDRLGLDTGVLVIFDRHPGAPSTSVRTTFGQAVTGSGRAVRALHG